MSGAVTALWRHPIKSHGREQLASVTLKAGEAMPWDRFWAVQHDQSTGPDKGWSSYQNFMVGTRTPGLAGLWAELDEDKARVHLRHARLGDFVLSPDDPDQTQAFFAWLAPVLPDNRAQPRRIVRAGTRGMTDTDFPSVSIMNASSHRAVSQKLGRDLEPERWRGNIWFDGMAPWEEFDWIGRKVQFGEAILAVHDRVERCMHTAASPITGERDADTLGALERGWGHRDFGVYAEVLQSGRVAPGDRVEVVG